jgi:hypothetical protein
MGEWRYNSIIYNIGSRQRRVAIFTLQPLFTRGNHPEPPLDRLYGPQNWSGEEIYRVMPGIEPEPSRSQPVLLIIELSRLLNWISENIIKLEDMGRGKMRWQEGGENYITRSFVIYTLWNDQVEEDEMDRACSPNGGRRGTRIGCWCESQRERGH